ESRVARPDRDRPQPDPLPHALRRLRRGVRRQRQRHFPAQVPELPGRPPEYGRLDAVSRNAAASGRAMLAQRCARIRFFIMSTADPPSSITIAARNRRNALKSTGPRTAEGKAIARRNAIKHGLTAADPTALGPEEGSLFNQMHEQLVEELAPR